MPCISFSGNSFSVCSACFSNCGNQTFNSTSFSTCCQNYFNSQCCSTNSSSCNNISSLLSYLSLQSCSDPYCQNPPSPPTCGAYCNLGVINNCVSISGNACSSTSPSNCTTISGCAVNQYCAAYNQSNQNYCNSLASEQSNQQQQQASCSSSSSLCYWQTSCQPGFWIISIFHSFISSQNRKIISETT